MRHFIGPVLDSPWRYNLFSAYLVAHSGLSAVLAPDYLTVTSTNIQASVPGFETGTSVMEGGDAICNTTAGLTLYLRLFNNQKTSLKIIKYTIIR